jgi:hypothetical protein
VELFHSQGVAVAPLGNRVEGEPMPPRDLVGVVVFSGPKATGTLTLSLQEPIYALFAPPVVGNHAIHDALRELTNQLIGRIKNRLLQFQVVLRIGIPSTMSEAALLRQRAPTTAPFVYLFRTLRGTVVVTFDSTLDLGTLNYSSAVRVANEGEFIPF